jgi:Arc/MetJ-type ribon-helix-helix transcriptional regulator
MPTSKIAVTVDRKTLEEVDSLVRKGRYPSRSRAVQAALELELRRERRQRLLAALAEADPEEERAMAEEGMGVDEWPEY